MENDYEHEIQLCLGYCFQVTVKVNLPFQLHTMTPDNHCAVNYTV